MPDKLLTHLPLLQAILKSMPHGLLLFNPDGIVLFANDSAESMLGYNSGSLAGSNIGQIFIKDDCRILLPNIIKLTMSEGQFSGEVLLCGKKGRIFAHIRTRLFKEKDSQLIVAHIEDISPFKTLQKSSREADRVLCLGKVVDRMAHHIRNPIAAIGGFAARLMKEGVAEEHKRLYQEIIYQEASRLESLLRSLADFTSLPYPSLANTSLDKLMARIRELLPEELQERASAWHVPSPEICRSLHAIMDLELMSQGIANVLTNALEAANPTVAIAIEAFSQDGSLQLSVKDTGTGISAEDLPFVFDPLFTTKTHHVGLGLTISQRIIEDHGGSIDIKSTPGQGTTVTVAVPVERRRAIRLRRL
ncbi:MAG: PAS domain S-box protein [Deltaproteobacteria bacterium]|nr:PAS domain S-box protein [Deltaproteobacteria bacterium]MBW2070838.1 PAS domain S-box protein [Deltaproteobacteria bacterium]